MSEPAWHASSVAKWRQRDLRGQNAELVLDRAFRDAKETPMSALPRSSSPSGALPQHVIDSLPNRM